jgi:hypothetical protein
VALDIDFADDLRASEVEHLGIALERRIKTKNPDVIALFLNPKGNSKVK